MDMREVLETLGDDYLGRASQACKKPTEVLRQVGQEVTDARAAARAQVVLEPVDAYPESRTEDVLDRLKVAKASFGLPRATASRAGWLARKLIWALANLSAALGLAIPGRGRELTPISKTGTAVARRPKELRPVSRTRSLLALWQD